MGRPLGPGESKLDPFRSKIEALLKNGAIKTFIAKRCGAKAANLHLWLNKRLLNQIEKIDVETAKAKVMPTERPYDYGKNNKIFTQDLYEKALEPMKQRLVTLPAYSD